MSHDTNNGEVMKSLDIHQIMELLPHRYPFLLLDRMEKIVDGERAVGIKNVTINEPFFKGHFPSRPVMPGVLIIEAMAQTAAALVMTSLGEEHQGKLVYFMTIESAKFRRPVEPGDQLHIHVEKIQHRRNVWKFASKAYVGGKIAAQSVLSAMIDNS